MSMFWEYGIGFCLRLSVVVVPKSALSSIHASSTIFVLDKI
jgi:hypothetical protein